MSGGRRAATYVKGVAVGRAIVGCSIRVCPRAAPEVGMDVVALGLGARAPPLVALVALVAARAACAVALVCGTQRGEKTGSGGRGRGCGCGCGGGGGGSRADRLAIRLCTRCERVGRKLTLGLHRSCPKLSARRMRLEDIGAC